jgi:hypothetical protein
MSYFEDSERKKRWLNFGAAQSRLSANVAISADKVSPVLQPSQYGYGLARNFLAGDGRGKTITLYEQ